MEYQLACLSHIHNKIMNITSIREVCILTVLNIHIEIDNCVDSSWKEHHKYNTYMY